MIALFLAKAGSRLQPHPSHYSGDLFALAVDHPDTRQEKQGSRSKWKCLFIFIFWSLKFKITQ